MSQLAEIARMARILTAIAEAGEARAERAGEQSGRVAVLRTTLEGVRWHVRGLFVAAFSETNAVSKTQDPKRHHAAKMLDEELVKLGNVVKGATSKLGPLYFPSEPFTDDKEARKRVK